MHNDVKPANFLLGRPGDAREAMVHLIDFGLASTATSESSGGAPPPPRTEPVGTPLFASVAAHDASPTAPVDDLESLVFTLAFLASGSLPWDQRRPEKAASMKRRLHSDGCEVLGEWCATHMLTEEVQSTAVANALQALWAEVTACRAGGETGSVDYGACAVALGDGACADGGADAALARLASRARGKS